MAKSYTAMPYSDDYTVQRGHVSPVSSRMYHEYYNMPTDEYMRLQLELEREQKRRLQAEKVARDLTRKLRRLEDKDYADRQNADKSKQKIRELQMLSRDLIARNKEKDEYNKRLLFENEAIKRSLLEAASVSLHNIAEICTIVQCTLLLLCMCF
jgi:ATPase subunit of ABC transporter with duplicated ATPase domains